MVACAGSTVFAENRQRRCDALLRLDNAGARGCPGAAAKRPHAKQRRRFVDAETQSPQAFAAGTQAFAAGTQAGIYGTRLGTNRWARCLSSLDEAVEALLPSVVAQAVKGDACARE